MNIRTMTKFLAVTLMCTMGTMVPAGAASKAANHDISGWIDAYQQFDLDRFLDYYADDIRFRDPTAQIDFTSKEQLKNAYSGIMQGRWGGNYRFDINSVVQEGNQVVLEGLFSLTFDGRQGKIHFTTWLEFEEGKIRHQLDMFDYNELQRQLPAFGKGFPSEYAGPRD